MFLQGKTALVTGSTSGIGLAYAKALAAEGANIIINGFGKKSEIDAEIEALKVLTGDGTVAYSDADLTDGKAVDDMMDMAEKDFGGVDILINNAGIQHVEPIEDFPPELWEKIISLNLVSYFRTIRRVIPHMKEAGWGRIIATASAHSLTASPFKSAYVTAKHGVAGLHKTVALEVATDNITANVISPGYVWTPLVENQIPDTMKARNMTREEVINDVLLAGQPTKKFSTPEEVAAIAIFLCRDEAANITGANISVDGGWTAQ